MALTLIIIGSLEIALAAIVCWLLLRPRRRNSSATAGGSLQHPLVAILLLAALVATAAIAGGFLVHEDTAWYQSNPGAGAPTPSTLQPILLVCYPAYIGLGAVLLAHLKSRLPEQLPAVRYNVAVAVLAPLAFLPAFDPAYVGTIRSIDEFVFSLGYWAIMAAWLVFGITPLLIRFCGLIAQNLPATPDR